MLVKIVIVLLAAYGFRYVAKKIPVQPGVLRVLIWFGLLLITIFVTTILMHAISGGTLVN
jgi:hypothetical protein